MSRVRSDFKSLLEISEWIGKQGPGYMAARTAKEIARKCSESLGYEVSVSTLKAPLEHHGFKTKLQAGRESASGHTMTREDALRFLSQIQHQASASVSEQSYLISNIEMRLSKIELMLSADGKGPSDVD